MSNLTDKPESLAWKPIVMFSASLLVLSVSLNNAGFKTVVDAWAKSIVANIENKDCKVPEMNQSIIEQVNNNTHSIEGLLINSHEPSG